MNISKLRVGQMDVNCYLVYDQNSSETLIIDPGDAVDYISDSIEKLHLKPIAIVATHGHFDHIMGVYDLALIYQIPFLMHEEDKFLLDRLSETAKYFLGYDVSIQKPKISKDINHNNTIVVGKHEVKIVHLPGHTPGSIGIVDKIGKNFIVGDTFFADGSIGRYDFSYSSHEKLQKSILYIKRNYSDYHFYPGHGELF
jgi:hydroxyacylglutathione hydrolase